MRLRGRLLVWPILVGMLALAWVAPEWILEAHLQQLAAAETKVADDAKPIKPKLVVMVVFDQFRGDYLQRWYELYGEGGFKRLLKEGAHFTNCHYPYSDTLTAVGHTSMATGTSPYRHGIVANEWYDRELALPMGAVESLRDSPVPMPILPKGSPRISGASPVHRKQEVIADVLLRATKGKSKIASLSIKDRSAILLAALRAQVCYWFSTAYGGFVTSTHYRDALHPWVADFNKSRMQDQWFGKEWTQFRPDLDYVKYSSIDDAPYEGTGFKQGRVFPHPFSLSPKIDKEYFGSVTCSPEGNDLLLALAKRCIDEEKLGQGDETDMLCLSFSCNDIVGHAYGPDSQEVLDITLRTDRLMKELLDTLDAKVGKGQYLLTMCADHGVCPIPEHTQKLGKEAGRVMVDPMKSAGNTYLQEKFGKNVTWIEEMAGSWFYLNQRAMKALKVSPPEVEKALAEWAKGQPGVLASYTRTQLLDKTQDDDRIKTMVRKSFFPETSGDVNIVVKPNYILTFNLGPAREGQYRTTHGSPHPYDTHVPLLVFGPGIQPGEHAEKIYPQALATIVPHALGIERPSGAELMMPTKLFAK